MDPMFRVSVEDARPKTVNLRLIYLMEKHYGVAGPVRMVTDGEFKFLFIEGPNFNLGIRAKKADEHWQSYNAKSGNQDQLRSNGTFPGWDVPTYHFMLAYRDSGGLQPHIIDIAITWQRRDVEVIWLMWTATLGTIPIEDQAIQKRLEVPPPEPTRIKRRKKPGDGDEKKKKRG